MTSRPESETPEVDVVVHNQITLAHVARSLERRLSLAQTEIKGHMRIEDELKVQIVRLGKDLACAQGNFHVTNQAYVKADAERAQAQARIAELEKDAARYRWLRDTMPMTIGAALKWPYYPAQHDYDVFDAKIDAAIDAALKDRA